MKVCFARLHGLWFLALALFFSVQIHAGIRPPLSGQDILSGRHLEIGSEHGVKGWAVVFLSAKCPCSRSHEPLLRDLAGTFSEFRFVGIHSNQDEKNELARPYFAKANLGFPVLEDAEALMANRLGAHKTPHAYLFDRFGEVVYQGGVDDSKHAENSQRSYLKEALVALRAGEAPAVRETRSIGCIIQR